MMTLVLVPRRLLEDAQRAINTLAEEVCGKYGAQWGVVDEALVGLSTALRVNMALEEEDCSKPCPPGQACDECAGYWQRMRDEGYWRDGEGWTLRGQQEYMKP